MSMNINLFILVIAVGIMLYALWMVVSLKKELPGGMIGRNVNYLLALVAFFAVGYVFVPFLGELSLDVMKLIVALLLAFGAVYVVVTINLIRNTIRILSE